MIEIFLFTKNEVDFISTFVNHHLSIADRLTVIDNGSTDGTWEILSELAKFNSHMTINQHFEPFQNKAKIVTDYMRNSSSQILIPMDTDEILAYESDDIVTTQSDKIKTHLHDLSNIKTGKLKIKQVYDFIPEMENWFSKKNQNKFAFLGSDFYSVDTGYHIGKTRSIENLIHTTNLAYLHFHFRSLESWLKSTEQKLRARLGDNWNTLEVLLEYKHPRPSHHVALEYSNYLLTGQWHNLIPYKKIDHNIKLCKKQY